MAEAKLNPCLFDKLTLDARVTEIIDESGSTQENPGVTQLNLKSSQIERYNEGAMRASVRRELNWLLNVVNLNAAVDLTRYPQVATSVLNYGMPDLTGISSTVKSVNTRAGQIGEMIALFEPRLNPDSLHVTARPGVNDDNAISYLIEGDIVSAVRAMPVKYFASVEVETGEAVVRE